MIKINKKLKNQKMAETKSQKRTKKRNYSKIRPDPIILQI